MLLRQFLRQQHGKRPETFSPLLAALIINFKHVCSKCQTKTFSSRGEKKKKGKKRKLGIDASGLARCTHMTAAIRRTCSLVVQPSLSLRLPFYRWVTIVGARTKAITFESNYLREHICRHIRITVHASLKPLTPEHLFNQHGHNSAMFGLLLVREARASAPSSCSHHLSRTFIYTCTRTSVCLS